MAFTAKKAMTKQREAGKSYQNDEKEVNDKAYREYEKWMNDWWMNDRPLLYGLPIT